LTQFILRAIIVEYFNNGERMATVNFSVPDEVKDAFNAAFEGRNKSAIVADLLREAVERERRRHEHVAASKAILSRWDKRPKVSAGAIRRAREELRR
jgi:metal-responsive CopG/Arc/MetJ family transcriptional regulator